jgi:hypothetical protein
MGNILILRLPAVTVEPKGDYYRAQKSYSTAERLKSFMDDLLLLESGKERRQRMIVAGERPSESEIKEENEYRQRRRALDKRKSEILSEFIFPSMANLTVFFEHAADPRLRKIFDKDIQALFFGKSQEDVNHEFVFNRFIRAALTVDSDTPSDDSRFVLIDMTQREIYNRVTATGSGKLSSDILLNNVLSPDMARAVGWTNYFAIEAYHNISFDKDRRPVLF